MPIFGIFWKTWGWKIWCTYVFHARLVFVLPIWYILRSFGIFVAMLVYFSQFGLLYQEKSGNPGRKIIKRKCVRICSSKGEIPL
jgi:hypothetical protein